MLYKIFKDKATGIPADWKVCTVKLNSLSFGSATNTYHKYVVGYDPTHGHWNFAKPELPSVYLTPRAVLGNVVVLEPEPAPKMPNGYSSSDMRKYGRERDFPANYHKLSWDYPCPHVDAETRYVHPGEDRFLSLEEVAALATDSEERIQAYLDLHTTYFTEKLWGEQNFEARYDRFSAKWIVSHFSDRCPVFKAYDFCQYTPREVCEISRKYPLPLARTRI